MRAVVVYEIMDNNIDDGREELLQMIADLNEKWYRNKRIVYVDFLHIDKNNNNKTNEKNSRTN